MSYKMYCEDSTGGSSWNDEKIRGVLRVDLGAGHEGADRTTAQYNMLSPSWSPNCPSIWEVDVSMDLFKLPTEFSNYEPELDEGINVDVPSILDTDPWQYDVNSQNDGHDQATLSKNEDLNTVAETGSCQASRGSYDHLISWEKLEGQVLIVPQTRRPRFKRSRSGTYANTEATETREKKRRKKKKTKIHEVKVQCSKSNTSERSLRKKKDPNLKRFACELCSHSFPYTRNLTVHRRSHTGERPYKCKYCGKCFYRSDTLSVHFQTHAKEKPHKCEICPKTFPSPSHLKTHVKTHTVKKQFLCEFCGKFYTQMGSLNVHIRIHTGVKPYRCETCNKSFVQATSLRIHMKIHAKEKQYPCTYCDRTFSRSCERGVHVRVHERPKRKKSALYDGLHSRLFLKSLELQKYNMDFAKPNNDITRKKKS